MDGMNYSLADIAAATNENGFGGNGSWWIILLFLVIFGGNGAWGNNWNRGPGEFGQYATAASQQEILFGQQFQNIDNKIDRLGNGIADLGYSNAQLINNAQTVLGGAITSEGRAIQTQLAQCCCDNQKNVDSLRYDMATLNANTNAVIHAEGEATRNMIQQNKIDALQAQVNELKTQNMFCGIPRINPYGYGVYAYQPQCGGCGCGNNYMNI